MGDPSDDGNESGSTDEETRPKTSDASDGSQRGHSSRSAGKPRTWRRATPWEVGKVATTPMVSRKTPTAGKPADVGGTQNAINGPLMGPPCAVKAARTVTTGGMGRHCTAVRPVPTHSIYSIVRRPSLRIQSKGRKSPETHDCPGGAVPGQLAHSLRRRPVPVGPCVVPCWPGTPVWCGGSVLACKGERPWRGEHNPSAMWC
jgi:hypothetical protein